MAGRQAGAHAVHRAATRTWPRSGRISVSPDAQEQNDPVEVRVLRRAAKRSSHADAGYPHCAVGTLASARSTRILSRPPARSMVWPHEPRRHGVQLVCVVFPWTLRRPGGVINPSRQLARVSGLRHGTWPEQGTWCRARSTAGTGADGLAAPWAGAERVGEVLLVYPGAGEVIACVSLSCCCWCSWWPWGD
jgi:hypothetical protein